MLFLDYKTYIKNSGEKVFILWVFSFYSSHNHKSSWFRDSHYGHSVTVHNFRYKSANRGGLCIKTLHNLSLDFIFILSVTVVTCRAGVGFVRKQFFVINSSTLIEILIVTPTVGVIGIFFWNFAQRSLLFTPAEAEVFVSSSTKWFPVNWRNSRRCNFRALLHQ